MIISHSQPYYNYTPPQSFRIPLAIPLHPFTGNHNYLINLSIGSYCALVNFSLHTSQSEISQHLAFFSFLMIQHDQCCSKRQDFSISEYYSICTITFIHSSLIENLGYFQYFFLVGGIGWPHPAMTRSSGIKVVPEIKSSSLWARQ